MRCRRGGWKFPNSAWALARREDSPVRGERGERGRAGTHRRMDPPSRLAARHLARAVVPLAVSVRRLSASARHARESLTARVGLRAER